MFFPNSCFFAGTDRSHRLVLGEMRSLAVDLMVMVAQAMSF